MLVYRLTKSDKRAKDLSGKGAFIVGGRWNSVGVFALYTSENRSLALNETLAHLEESEFPTDFWITAIEIQDTAPIYIMPDHELPGDWRLPENLILKDIGDRILKDGKFLCLKVRSAVMPHEFNYVLNPFFPEFNTLAKIVDVSRYDLDRRLYP